MQRTEGLIEIKISLNSLERHECADIVKVTKHQSLLNISVEFQLVTCAVTLTF